MVLDIYVRTEYFGWKTPQAMSIKFRQAEAAAA